MISMRHPFKLFKVFKKKSFFLKSLVWPNSFVHGTRIRKEFSKGPIGRKFNKVPYHRIYTVVEGFEKRIKNNVPMNRKKSWRGNFSSV